MRLSELRLTGAFLVEAVPIHDERGHFARAWCRQEFLAVGIKGEFVQASLSHTSKKGTVRGMHYQLPPSYESKLVRCTRGAICDVVVDIRPDSPTYLEYVAVELNEENGLALYIPSGMAHGFQTLTDKVDVFYEMTDVYAPDLAGGFRFDDPRVNIEFPLEATVIGKRDASYPDISVEQFNAFAS